MAALLAVRFQRRRAEPEFVVEFRWRLFLLKRSTLRVFANARFDGANLAQPAIADQFAGQTEASIGALLAPRLEDNVVGPGHLDHGLAFVDGER